MDVKIQVTLYSIGMCLKVATRVKWDLGHLWVQNLNPGLIGHLWIEEMQARLQRRGF